ncbi:alpha/beta hydrolase [Frondihabitans cladoniiphilus]|uniref:AB hydrolase-1 domain-containing protein n=1 Tax=Frondihabitans cladoniiphilus TaxID=715785 RepID=A0ABP8W4X9_9MICO
MRGYVDTDWGQIHYRAGGHPVAGASKVIAFYHESPRSSFVYEPVLDSFPEGVAVLAFDTPGFGQSDSAPAGVPLSEYGRVLIQALDNLGVGEFLPVGMKTGSSLVVNMASQLDRSRVPAVVLYNPEAPNDEESERWALTWAPTLEFPADGYTLEKLYKKNVGLYGTDNPRVLYEAVAETIINADRYNSIYPTVFRAHTQTWNDMHDLIAGGTDVTIFRPSSGQMTPDDPIEFADIEGTKVVAFDVTGQFPALAHDAFVEAVEVAAGLPVPAAS